MKWFVIAFGIFAVVFFICFYFAPNDLHGITETNVNYDAYVQSQGVNPDMLLNEEKALIYDNQLKFTVKFKKTDFIPDSANPYIFDRDWEEESKLDYEKQPKITLTGYLFSSEDAEYLFINYTYPEVDTERVPDYFVFDFSSHYTLRRMQAFDYYLNEGKEFEASESYTNDYNNHQLSLPAVKSRHLKKTILSGFALAVLTKEADYNSNYFECRIDFYEAESAETKTAALGFNAFVSQNKGNLYIPSSLTAAYTKGD